MINSMLTKIRMHLVVTAASVVCVMVAVVALGLTVYEALRLVVIPVAAAGLTALIFFVLAAGALAFLQFVPRRPEPEEPRGAAALLSSVDWGRFAPLAGQLALAVTTILADRARSGRERRRDRRRDRR